MKRRDVLIVIGTAALLLIGGLATLVTRHSSRITARVSKGTLYYCPMHPTYTSDRPGDCPICNMKLVKREQAPADAVATAQAAETICILHNCPKLHEGRPCPMTVVAKPGERITCPICGTYVADTSMGKLKKLLYWTDPMIPGYRSEKPGTSPMGMDLVPVYEEEGAIGSDTASPDGYTPVLISPQKQQLIGVTTAPVTRRALTKTIRTVGRIAYDPELYQAEQEYLQALNTLMKASLSDSRDVRTQAERLVEASRIRLRLLGLNEELINAMFSWEAPDRRLLGTDPSGEVWLYASIYEFELPLVRVGQTVTAEGHAIPGKRLTGVIRAIDPVLDPSTRAARVRAVLADPDRILKPEMFVNAFIAVPVGEVIAVPEAAVIHTGTTHLVFVDKGQGLLEPREVVMGAAAEGYTEVKAGVAEGEPVVTSGNFLIDSESRLKAALQGAAGGAGHQHGQ